MWIVTYESNIDYTDGTFSEWWSVKYGSRAFRTSSDSEAKMLASVFNAIEDKSTDFYDGSVYDGEIHFANKLVKMIG